MQWRKWSGVKAEMYRRNPDMDSPEAQERREQIRAEHEARIRGYALSTLRKHAGLAQKDVAEHMGTSRSRVSEIERGKISSLDVLHGYVDSIGGEVHITVTVNAFSARLELPSTESAPRDADREACEVA